MPNSFHKRAVAIAALITSGTVGMAAAETQEVMIFEEAFFPNVIYVQPGDEVTFLNMADSTRKVAALDESWMSAPISVESSWTYAVTEESFLSFQGISEDDTTSEEYVGALTFDKAPLSE